MTAILEIKQKIKGFYEQYELYIMPIIKFVLALVFFLWINANMGYMSQLDNMFVILILALICSILPSPVTNFVGFLLMIGHSYALGMEVAGFMIVLVLLMTLFFLRFSAGHNIVLAFTPLSFGFNVPVLLPIGSGLLSSPLSAIPAGCGVVLYYFIRFIRSQSNYLANPDVLMIDKLKLLSDGLVKNWAMWITVLSFILAILLVNLIRTRSFDYAWRIAIIVGGVTYVLVIFGGSFFLNITIAIPQLITYTVVSVVIGMLLELFVFGGDYSRVEKLQYEDDEYYYFVKAVPKSAIASSERSIKKINAEPLREEKKADETVVSYANPIFHGDEKPAPKTPVKENFPPVEKPKLDSIDFEKKLEESLKDL